MYIFFVSDSILYLEGAIKEVASFQDAYNQIRKNNNIPEDWDENNFEKAEIKHHVKQAFLLAYRDTLQNNCANQGTMEYMHQFGLNPQSSYSLIRDYIKQNDETIQDSECSDLPSYNNLEDFLEEMAEIHKDCYKDAMKRMGLDKLHNEMFMYQEKYT